jgi:hypothetical protein
LGAKGDLALHEYLDSLFESGKNIQVKIEIDDGKLKAVVETNFFKAGYINRHFSNYEGPGAGGRRRRVVIAPKNISGEKI